MPANDSFTLDQQVAVNRSTGVHRGRFTPNIGALLIGLLAMIALQMFRLSHTRWLPIVVAEIVVFFALPCVAYFLLTRLKGSDNWFDASNGILGFRLGAILVGILFMLWHYVIRFFGLGDATEVIALLTIQSIGWYLAVFSKVPGFEKACAILCGSIVFFVCCIAEEMAIFLVAGLFAFAGLWWLLGQYWNRLETKAIDGDSRSLKLDGSAVSLTMLIVGAVACLAAAVPLSQKGIFLPGFMPFSGGEEGISNEFAISGIGDGDMLTSGNNATTTGAVDSDEVMEDHKRSLYDALSERYDGPVMKQRHNKVITLDMIAKHMHEIKQSEQAGRTFRTMRNSDKTTDLELEDRITNALFFVEGSVPARFAMDNYCHFDGWDWSSEPNADESTEPPTISLSRQGELPVFSIVRGIANYLTGQRSHRVKIMRLDSGTIPAPAMLHQWHIPRVDKQEMFGWNDKGLLEMVGQTIPTHTLIDLQSFVPNYHLLRAIKSIDHAPSAGNSLDQQNNQRGSQFLQVPDSPTKPEIQTLASNWTTGIEPGWKQVESVVGHLRNDFALNPAWKPDERAEDTVNQFLKQGGGPSYMFATTCAMALRSAGYKTRLTSGFLLQKQDYDSRARQSIVTAENLHMWPEVCLDGKFWIPVEPTPGYPIPYSTQTAWQWFTAQVAVACTWIVSNPLTVALFAGASVMAILFRAEWITSLMFGWWYLVRMFWPPALLKTTRQLIDLRFWFAGDRRPASQTIDVWYARVESSGLAQFFRLWNAKNYSDYTVPASNQELVGTCRRSVNSLSLKRIRDFLNVTKKASLS